jgi:hypothetical protein
MIRRGLQSFAWFFCLLTGSAAVWAQGTIQFMFLVAANECYWRIHFSPDLRSFTCDKTPQSNPYDWWRAGDAQNPEISLMGQEYFFNTLHPDPVYNPTCAIKVIHPSTGQWPTYYNGQNGGMWPFDYTQISPSGSQDLAGLLGYELDLCRAGSDCNL